MPITEEQSTLLKRAFRPHAPIEDPGAFKGRATELTAVRDVATSDGLHSVITGERGSGKTSLANVATNGLVRLKVFSEKKMSFPRLAKAIALEYQGLHPQRLRYDAVTDTLSCNGLSLKASSLTGNDLRSLIPKDESIIIIIDEIDQINNAATIEKLAEFAKNLSTDRPKAHLVFVGVAKNAAELLQGHLSNHRNLRQTPLERMGRNELNEILTFGEGVLGIGFSESAKRKVIDLTDRMPYYVHLLATESARAALESDDSKIDDAHVQTGVKKAAKDAGAQLGAPYEQAILSTKRSKLYKHALWALAALPENKHNVTDIYAEAKRQADVEGRPMVTVQALGQTLKKLTQTNRSSILTLHGSGIYGFSEPLMKGYCRLMMEQDD